MAPLTILLVLALATAAVSVTVTKSRIFSWLRLPIMRRSQLFGELITCPYCFSHYVSIVLLKTSAWALPIGFSVVFDALLTWLALIGATAVITKQMPH